MPRFSRERFVSCIEYHYLVWGYLGESPCFWIGDQRTLPSCSNITDCNSSSLSSHVSLTILSRKDRVCNVLFHFLAAMMPIMLAKTMCDTVCGCDHCDRESVRRTQGTPGSTRRSHLMLGWAQDHNKVSLSLLLPGHNISTQCSAVLHTYIFQTLGALIKYHIWVDGLSQSDFKLGSLLFRSPRQVVSPHRILMLLCPLHLNVSFEI